MMISNASLTRGFISYSGPHMVVDPIIGLDATIV